MESFSICYLNYLYSLKSKSLSIPAKATEFINSLPEPNPLPSTKEPNTEIIQIFNGILGFQL